MPSNLYGNANPNPLPIIGGIIGGTNVVINPGAEQNFFSIAVPPAVSPGWYYPAVYGIVAFALTATPPTFLNWAGRIGAGSDFQVQATWNSMLVANANLEMTLLLYGYTTFVSNPFGATTFNVSATCGANAFTVISVGTTFYGQWLRAPDQ